MTIPDYQTLMLPLLRQFADGHEHGVREVRDAVGVELHLSTEDLQELVPSGRKLLFADRLNWATTYLKHAGLLEHPRRGVYRITPTGAELLARNLSRIDNSVLGQFPEFTEFQNRATTSEAATSTAIADSATPGERFSADYLRLRGATEADLLQQVKDVSPAFFENLVVRVLVAMGYGGTIEDAGKAVVGRTGDEGIDAIIKQDRLGLETIHVQAKRWTTASVGRPDVQSFAGSLDGVRSRKGIYITTSTFTADARAYVDKIEKKIILIDGKELARLMFDFDVGVTATESYVVKKIDMDSFSED